MDAIVAVCGSVLLKHLRCNLYSANKHNMENEITPTETTELIETIEPVKNAEAVLRKNKELLEENAKLKRLAEKAGIVTGKQVRPPRVSRELR